MPLVTLMKDIGLFVNTTHFNFSELTEKMQLVIDSTLKAAQQVRLYRLASEFEGHNSHSLTLCSGHVCVTVWQREREIEVDSGCIMTVIFTHHSNETKRPIFQRLSLMQVHSDDFLCAFFQFRLLAQTFTWLFNPRRISPWQHSHSMYNYC